MMAGFKMVHNTLDYFTTSCFKNEEKVNIALLGCSPMCQEEVDDTKQDESSKLADNFNANIHVDFFKFVFMEVLGFSADEMFQWIKFSIADNTLTKKK